MLLMQDRNRMEALDLSTFRNSEESRALANVTIFITSIKTHGHVRLAWRTAMSVIKLTVCLLALFLQQGSSPMEPSYLLSLILLALQMTSSSISSSLMKTFSLQNSEGNSTAPSAKTANSSVSDCLKMAICVENAMMLSMAFLAVLNADSMETAQLVKTVWF